MAVLACALVLRSGEPVWKLQEIGENPDVVTVLNSEETVEIQDLEGTAVARETADVDTGATYSSIDGSIVRELGIDLTKARIITVSSALGREYRPVVRIRITVGGRTFETEATVANRSGLNNPILVGRKDMDGFLIQTDEEGEKTTEIRSGTLVPASWPGAASSPMALLAAFSLVAAATLILRALAGLESPGLFAPALMSISLYVAGPAAGLTISLITMTAGLAGGLIAGTLRFQKSAGVIAAFIMAIFVLGSAGLLSASPGIGPVPPSLLPAAAGALAAERCFNNSNTGSRWGNSLDTALWIILIGSAGGTALANNWVRLSVAENPYLALVLSLAAMLAAGLYHHLRHRHSPSTETATAKTRKR